MYIAMENLQPKLFVIGYTVVEFRTSLKTVIYQYVEGLYQDPELPGEFVLSRPDSDYGRCKRGHLWEGLEACFALSSLSLQEELEGTRHNWHKVNVNALDYRRGLMNGISESESYSISTRTPVHQSIVSERKRKV